MSERRKGSKLCVQDGKVTVERKAHKTMTSDEYAAMKIIGWHMVCKDYDGFGGVGVRFLTDGTEGECLRPHKE